MIQKNFMKETVFLGDLQNGTKGKKVLQAKE